MNLIPIEYDESKTKGVFNLDLISDAALETVSEYETIYTPSPKTETYRPWWLLWLFVKTRSWRRPWGWDNYNRKFLRYRTVITIHLRDGELPAAKPTPELLAALNLHLESSEDATVK